MRVLKYLALFSRSPWPLESCSSVLLSQWCMRGRIEDEYLDKCLDVCVACCRKLHIAWHLQLRRNRRLVCFSPAIAALLSVCRILGQIRRCQDNSTFYLARIFFVVLSKISSLHF